MKTKKILFAIVLICLMAVGCKKEAPKEVKNESIALAISGMTCEIGCAKTIQSKLSKKEGVLDAKVVFSDSIANIAFDANTTSKKDLIAFIDGIAGGEMYKASESSEKLKSTKKSKKCSEKCKKECELNADKKTCNEACKMACSKNKEA